MDFDDKSMCAPIIPVHLPAAFVRMCAVRGYPIAAILDNSGIQIDDLDSIDTYFTLNQIAKIVQNALYLTQDPSISIAFSQHIRLSHFGSFGVALMSAPTLHDVFAICRQYSALIDPTISFDSEIKDQTICIKFGKQIPLGLNYYYTQEALCLSIIRILSDLLEHELPQLKIELDYLKNNEKKLLSNVQIKATEDVVGEDLVDLQAQIKKKEIKLKDFNKSTLYKG